MDTHDSENLVGFYQTVGNNDIYAQRHKIRIVSVTEEGAVGDMVLTPRLLANENGDLHGGAMFTLADAVAGSAAHVWGVRHWGPMTTYTTASASFNYMRPYHLNGIAPDSRVICKATLRKTGRTLCVTDICITNEDGEELCRGCFTGCYIDKERYYRAKKTNNAEADAQPQV